MNITDDDDFVFSSEAQTEHNNYIRRGVPLRFKGDCLRLGKFHHDQSSHDVDWSSSCPDMAQRYDGRRLHDISYDGVARNSSCCWLCENWLEVMATPP